MKIGGMCLNWKVIAGLALVGVAIWILAPNLVVAALPLLLVAACPLSMLFMMRGMGNMQGGTQGMQGSRMSSQSGQGSEIHAVPLTREERFAALRDHLASVQAEQDALARDIAANERPDAPVMHEAEAIARAADEQIKGRS